MEVACGRFGWKIDAPNLKLTVTDDATFKHSSFTLKALTVGGNLVAMESVELTLKTIGNIGNIILKMEERLLLKVRQMTM